MTQTDTMGTAEWIAEGLFDYEPSLFMRMMLIWAFVLVGLVIAVQLSQTQTDTPLRGTRFTKDTG